MMHPVPFIGNSRNLRQKIKARAKARINPIIREIPGLLIFL